MAVRERLDRRTALSREYVTMRGFTYEGRSFDAGEDFPVGGLSFHVVQTLHGSRHIDLKPVADSTSPIDQDCGVTLASKSGGNYEITAAWLPEPLKVRGKDKAESEAQRVREEGPPLGFIEGGTEVQIEEQAGGWYVLTAPWMDFPEKVQGRMLAEQRQREIHEAGEPAYHHGVSLTASGGGWFDLKADWEPESRKVQGETEARQLAAQLRAAGEPEAEPFRIGDVVRVGPDAGELSGRKGVINTIDGESAEIYSFGETPETKADLTTGTVPLANLSREPAPGADSSTA